MLRTAVSGVILTLLLGMSTLAFNLQTVMADREPNDALEHAELITPSVYETVGLLIVYALYVSGDTILFVDAQGRIVETDQTFQTNGVEGFSTELPAGNYTIEVTYENETEIKRAEILEGQTTYLHFGFGDYMEPPRQVGGIYIPVNKLSLIAPYIGLTMLLAVAVVTVGYVKKKKQ